MTETLINTPTIVSLAAGITAIGGAWLTMRRIARDGARQREEHSAKILQSAKQADQELKLKLENKIHELELQLVGTREGLEKDIEHLREYHSSELKNLSDKIESLREELRQQTTGILNLLTKLVDNKKD
jgi:glycerol-3-phosphate dehydrogenase